MPAYGFHEPEVRRTLKLIAPEIFELRALEAKVDDNWRTGTFSGFYDADHHDDVIRDLGRIQFARGVYITPNPCKSALLARRYNRAEVSFAKDDATSDKHIVERRWLMIDVDASPVSGVSTHDVERDAALRIITDIDHHLFEQGYPPGVIADSGNGSHLLIPFRMKNDEKSLAFHKKLLADLAKAFDTDIAHVDVTTCNAARIWRLYGCMNCKGDNCPELGRVWRLSRILTVCEEV
jgi:hypothetical protein